ncbi:MAG: biotin--[acetyl-CoA-carboxylase] ligase [Alphaproteobacteria bacterium]|nr:biotin--[acetyl-CoA-carboxylase] ligase [Alphaproteobacteria bacterium]OJV13620.1 MAG: biotin--[acetyl-CoA-carboxylase] ligase [Alphaproteobacteria bacterium 33-17]
MRSIPSNLLDLTKILNDLEYHDGDSLGEALGMTRSGVWKMIKKLEDYGIQIESVKSKGYKFQEELALLDYNVLSDKIPANLEVFENIDSTNTHIKKYIGDKSPWICVSETQENGKGRLGRSWQSPFGQNLYFSVLYPFKKDISELLGLSLVTALSIIQTLEEDLEIKADIKAKWPNDIVLGGKKLAGILTEIYSEANGTSYAVIGVGLNVNMISQGDIDQPWTSLKLMTQSHYNRNEMLALIVENLLGDLEIFANYGFENFRKSWFAKDALLGQKVSLLHNNTLVSGKAIGISELGNLLLEVDKEIKSFSSGDAYLSKSLQ